MRGPFSTAIKQRRRFVPPRFVSSQIKLKVVKNLKKGREKELAIGDAAKRDINVA